MRELVIRTGKICLWALAGILMVVLIIGRPGLALASEKAEAQSIVDKSKGVHRSDE